MIYLSCFVVFTGLLFINNRKRFLYATLSLLLALPSSLQFGSLVYVSGVYWVDVLIIMIVLYFLLSMILVKSITLDKRYIYLLVPIVIISIYSLFFFYQGFDEVESLKDYRPLLFFTLVGFFGFLCDKVEIPVSLIHFCVKVCLVSVIVWGGVSYIGILNAEDRFYQPEFRYLGLQTYFCLFYLVFSFSKKDIDFKYIFIAYAVIILSMSRMLLGLSLIPLAVWLIVSHFSIKKAVLFLFVILAAVLLSGSSLFEKFQALFEQGIDVFFYNRYSPALDKITSMHELNYIFGFGFGEKFYIPWFEYRENINNYSIQLDSAYLNFFTKYGMLSFFVLIFPLLFFNNENRMLTFCSVLILLIQYLTSSVYYHMAFLGFYICFIVCMKVKENE